MIPPYLLNKLKLNSSQEDSEEVSDYKGRGVNSSSESGDNQSSNENSEDEHFFSDISQSQGELYEVDGPVQLVKVSEDLSSFEV